jgi:hypothetical protein
MTTTTITMDGNEYGMTWAAAAAHFYLRGLELS